MHLILYWLGLKDSAGSGYLFWSGIFSDITIFIGIFTWYLHNQCHVKTCHKLGKFPFQHYKLCKIHHPKVPKDITHLHIAKLNKHSSIK